MGYQRRVLFFFFFFFFFSFNSILLLKKMSAKRGATHSRPFVQHTAPSFRTVRRPTASEPDRPPPQSEPVVNGGALGPPAGGETHQSYLLWSASPSAEPLNFSGASEVASCPRSLHTIGGGGGGGGGWGGVRAGTAPRLSALPPGRYPGLGLASPARGPGRRGGCPQRPLGPDQSVLHEARLERAVHALQGDDLPRRLVPDAGPRLDDRPGVLDPHPDGVPPGGQRGVGPVVPADPLQPGAGHQPLELLDGDEVGVRPLLAQEPELLPFLLGEGRRGGLLPLAPAGHHEVAPRRQHARHLLDVELLVGHVLPALAGPHQVELAAEQGLTNVDFVVQ